jgi:pyochelin biosynthetic protein PchC
VRDDHPALRLVCFPHSGGSVTTYRSWAPLVPEGVELLAVQYPQHADRFAEPPAGSVAEMGAAVAAELATLDRTPVALFGHSLGALVSYETARALTDAGFSPRLLFVSGCPAPELAGGGTTHTLPDDELWTRLLALGGTDSALAADDEIRDLVLPVLRSDITLHETYRPAPPVRPLSCPIRCHYNTDDPLVPDGSFATWADATSGPFSVRAWPGGHFHHLTDPTALVADVCDNLVEVVR